MRIPWIGSLAIMATLVAAGALSIGHVGCGGDDVNVCGNARVERGEECDCGTDPYNLPAGCNGINGGVNSGCSDRCALREVSVNQVRIHWTINGESMLGTGSFDTCNDVGATYVHVRLQSTGGYVGEEPQQSCGDYVASFTDDPQNAPLNAGQYTVYLELQTADGSALAPQAYQDFTLNPGPDNEVWVDFPLDSFYDYDNMTGDLLFRLHWGAMGTRCADAVPAVATQSITLEQGSTSVAGFPEQGACSDSTRTLSDMTPGEYTIRVEGFDSQSERQYCYTQELRVGAGVQPSYQLVIPTLDASNCGE